MSAAVSQVVTSAQVATTPRSVPVHLRKAHEDVLANLDRLARFGESPNPMWVRRVTREAHKHVLNLMAVVLALEESEADLVAKLQAASSSGRNTRK